MRNDLLNPLEDPRWDGLVAGSKRSSVFHHPAWLRLLEAQYGYELSAACALADDGRLVAGLPLAKVSSRLTGKRFVALPFSDLCPVLGDGAGVASVVAQLEELQRETGRTVRVHAELGDLPNASSGPSFFHHLVPLGPDPEAAEARFSKSQVKRGIKKARREGLETERTTASEALEHFYRLHLRTRRRQGVPTQPKRFITRLTSLFDEGLGFVMLVRDGEKVAAAAVFLTHGDVITYKYGASDDASLPKRPNNLLFGDLIRWGCENGYAQLDLGRTDLDNEGLRSFKLGWGAEEQRLTYTTIGGKPGDAEPSGPAARAARGLIKRSPPFVGRLFGEALYGHFG